MASMEIGVCRGCAKASLILGMKVKSSICCGDHVSPGLPCDEISCLSHHSGGQSDAKW